MLKRRLHSFQLGFFETALRLVVVKVVKIVNCRNIKHMLTNSKDKEAIQYCFFIFGIREHMFYISTSFIKYSWRLKSNKSEKEENILKFMKMQHSLKKYRDKDPAICTSFSLLKNDLQNFKLLSSSKSTKEISFYWDFSDRERKDSFVPHGQRKGMNKGLLLIWPYFSEIWPLKMILQL